MKKNIIIIFILSIAGCLFSGYLSLVKLFSDVCPINEGCATFLGYPACYYGFLIFLILFVASLVLLIKNLSDGRFGKTICFASLAGIVFSGYFTIIEVFIIDCGSSGCYYPLLLPSCVYGLILYSAILVFSCFLKEKEHAQEKNENKLEEIKKKLR